MKHINDKISLFLFSTIILTIGYIIYADCNGEFEKHISWVHSVDNNKKGITVSASENELLVWANRRCINRLVGHSETIKTVAFSHDGIFFASGSFDKSIKIWSLTKNKSVKKIEWHTKGVNKVEFSASDKYLISAGYDDLLSIWDWKNQTIVTEFKIKHTDFSISKTDVLVFVDNKCNLVFFDLKSLNVVKVFSQICGIPVFHPNQNIIGVKELGKSNFTFIDINTRRIVSFLNTKKANTICEASIFTFTPDGNYIVTNNCDVEIWDWKQKKIIHTLRSHATNSVEDFSFNDKDELIIASGDGSLNIWDWRNEDLKMVIGDGLFQTQMIRLLKITIFLTLFSSFWAITFNNTQNRFSSFSILTILTVWSFGILLGFYYSQIVSNKSALKTSLIATVLSGLFISSGWFSFLALLTIPLALFSCYILLKSDRQEHEIKPFIYLLIINFLFVGYFAIF